MTDDLEKLKAAHERLQVLYQVSNVIHSTLDSQQALRLILQEVVRLMRASSGSVVLLNPNNDLLEIQASTGLPPGPPRSSCAWARASPAGSCAHGKPVRLGDVRKDPRYIMLAPRGALGTGRAAGGHGRGARRAQRGRRPGGGLQPTRTRNCWRSWRCRRPR